MGKEKRTSMGDCFISPYSIDEINKFVLRDKDGNIKITDPKQELLIGGGRSERGMKNIIVIDAEAEYEAFKRRIENHEH